jgi:hypothetical protein
VPWSVTGARKCLRWQHQGNKKILFYKYKLCTDFYIFWALSNLLSPVYEWSCTWHTEHQHMCLTSIIWLIQFQNILKSPDLLSVQYSGNYEKCWQGLHITWMCFTCGATAKQICLWRCQMLEMWEKLPPFFYINTIIPACQICLFTNVHHLPHICYQLYLHSTQFS